MSPCYLPWDSRLFTNKQQTKHWNSGINTFPIHRANKTEAADRHNIGIIDTATFLISLQMRCHTKRYKS